MTTRAEGYQILWDMVATLKYRDGWIARIFGGQPPFTGKEQLNLNFECSTTDNRDRKTPYTSAHLFVVPKSAWSGDRWMDWLFAQCQKIDLHEAMELFEVNGQRPYWPHDNPDRNSYVLKKRSECK